MNAEAYDKLRKIVYDHGGIKLSDGKKSMVGSRIARRLRTLQLEDELAYVDYLESAMDEELVHLLDAVSTNVTAFYREAHHFETVRWAMNQWLAAGQSRFRFWSAACSTGEEPYTLAITLLEAIRESGRKVDVKILATDINTKVLEEAEAGRYPAKRLETVPESQRQRYMHRQTHPKEPHYQVRRELRDMIVFRRMNLAKPPFPMRGPMDIIFCRNAMIYFDDAIRRPLLEEYHRLLRPDGYLMVGHAESLTKTGDLFARDGSSVYRPVH